MLIKRHIIVISEQCLNTNHTSDPAKGKGGDLWIPVFPRWVIGVDDL